MAINRREPHPEPMAYKLHPPNPCILCGSREVEVQKRGDEPIVYYPDGWARQRLRPEYTIMCGKCRAYGGVFVSPAQAIKVWNRVNVWDNEDVKVEELKRRLDRVEKEMGDEDDS